MTFEEFWVTTSQEGALRKMDEYIIKLLAQTAFLAGYQAAIEDLKKKPQ